MGEGKGRGKETYVLNVGSDAAIFILSTRKYTTLKMLSVCLFLDYLANLTFTCITRTMHYCTYCCSLDVVLMYMLNSVIHCFSAAALRSDAMPFTASCTALALFIRRLDVCRHGLSHVAIY